MCLRRETCLSFIISSFWGHWLFKHPWTDGPKCIGNTSKQTAFQNRQDWGQKVSAASKKQFTPKKASLPAQPTPVCCGLQAVCSHPNAISGRSWLPNQVNYQLKTRGNLAERGKHPNTKSMRQKSEKSVVQVVFGREWCLENFLSRTEWLISFL